MNSLFLYGESYGPDLLHDLAQEEVVLGLVESPSILSSITFAV
jgi:hypothetical protein